MSDSRDRCVSCHERTDYKFRLGFLECRCDECHDDLVAGLAQMERYKEDAGNQRRKAIMDQRARRKR